MFQVMPVRWRIRLTLLLALPLLVLGAFLGGATTGVLLA